MCTVFETKKLDFKKITNKLNCCEVQNSLPNAIKGSIIRLSSLICLQHQLNINSPADIYLSAVWKRKTSVHISLRAGVGSDMLRSGKTSNCEAWAIMTKED